MGAIAVDVNNIMDVNAAVFRVIHDTLGDDVVRAFVGQFKNNTDIGKPRLTAAQFAAALEQGKAMAAEMIAISASVGGGRGDFTKERHERPEFTHEELVAGINKLQEEGLKAGKHYIN